MTVDWPTVVLVALLLIRDEFRFWRAHADAKAVRDTVEHATVVVRRGDDTPRAAAAAISQRRSTDHGNT